MIGHYLLTLTPEEEDRVLTQRFRPIFPNLGTGCRCLVMTATNNYPDWHEYGPPPRHPGMRYESLCHRFPEARVNAAIRNRILSNRARRTLSQPSYAVA